MRNVQNTNIIAIHESSWRLACGKLGGWSACIGKVDQLYVLHNKILTWNSWDMAKIAIPAEGHSLTACNAAPPAKSKIAARGPQNDRGGIYP